MYEMRVQEWLYALLGVFLLQRKLITPAVRVMGLQSFKMYKI
jgi:hypothetical protein